MGFCVKSLARTPLTRASFPPSPQQPIVLLFEDNVQVTVGLTQQVEMPWGGGGETPSSYPGWSSVQPSELASVPRL